MSRKEINTQPLTEDESGTEVETQENKPVRNRRYLYVLLYVAMFAFVVYAVVTLISIHSQIKAKRDELKEIEGEITVQEIKNDEMSKMYNYSDDEFAAYVEQIARDDLDYVKAGERVFVNVAGD